MSLNVSPNLPILFDYLIRHQRLHKKQRQPAANPDQPSVHIVVTAPKVPIIGENAQVPTNAPSFRTAAAVP